MTTDLEKQFFSTFGIEPKKQCYYWDCPYSTGNIVNDTAMNERDCNSCKNPNKEIYPQITDRILLELICILADLYNSNSHGYPLLSKDIKELKEDVLDDLMGAIDVANDYPEGYANKVRTLFEEGVTMNPNHIGTNFDDFLKEEGIMTDKQIMIDGVDVNALYSDQIACMNRYEVANLFIKTVEQLKHKEQECEKLKLLNNRLNSALGYRRAGKKTFIDLSVELDQLKAEKETLKQYKASKQASYESMQREWNNAVLENRELHKTLTEIKEIVNKNYKTEEELFKIRHSRLPKFSMGASNGRHNLASEILQKISEVEDEHNG